MDFCFLALFWLFMIIFFFITGLSHHFYSLLPSIIRDAVVYGKLHDKKKRTFVEEILLVPKRWFAHFYVLSFIWNGMTLLFVQQCIFLGTPLPAWYVWLLEWLTSYPIAVPSVDLPSVLIVTTLIVVQAARRIYECFFVSVYSSSNIHVAHYLIGILFYAFVGICVLGEAPEIHEQGEPQQFNHLLRGLKWNHALGLLIFLWASWHHHKAHRIFASLRKGKHDENRHSIPKGDWFDYISSPHYLAEILIYTSLSVILGGRHGMWWLLVGFVLSNQTVAALEIHRWYRTKFEDYPKERKALVPFIM